MEKENGSWDIVGILNYLLPMLLIFVLVAPIVYIPVSAIYYKIAQEKADYETYGCYRVEKEYQECGPVEGKPGFTRCETKKELVCPEVAN